MKERHFILFVLGISVFLFFWQLGSVTFIDEDEAVYSQVAQEMLTTGDWLYPGYNGSYWVDKPPLVPWAIALSMKLLGRTEFAIRFWQSILAMLCVLLVFFTGKELFGAPAGFYSAAILAASLQFFYQARIALCDITLVFFITLSLYFFLLKLRRGKTIFYYLSVASMALAVMAKGPVGAVLPVLVIIVYLAFTRKKVFSSKPGIHIFSGIVLFLLITAPWFCTQALRYRGEFLHKFFIYKNIDRLFHPIDTAVSTGKPDPFYVYFFIITAGFLPWSGVMFYNFFSMLKKAWKEKKDEYIFILSWAGVVLVLFSLVGQKATRYIMPVYPALALITGLYFARERGAEENRTAVIVPFIISLALSPFLVGLAYFAQKQFPAGMAAYGPAIIPSIVILGIGIGISSFLLFVKDKRMVFIAFLITGLLGFGTLIYNSKSINTIRVSKRFAAVITPLAGKADRIIDYKPEYNPESSLIFYLNRHVDFIDSEASFIAALNSGKRAFCVIPSSELDRFRDKAPVRILDESSGRSLITNK